ncbi:hypothetical protein [Shewanella frigidimarina]|uniref:hypothetical protein n=1 Tax=Shewanella frigidimarina TaxID=56812 RepID=UPI003D79E95B
MKPSSVSIVSINAGGVATHGILWFVGNTPHPTKLAQVITRIAFSLLQTLLTFLIVITPL